MKVKFVLLFPVDCFSWWLRSLYIWRSWIVSIYKFDLSLWKFWRPNRWCLPPEKLWANLFQKPGCYLPETTLYLLKRFRPCRALRFHFPILSLAQNWLSQWQCWNKLSCSEHLLSFMFAQYSLFISGSLFVEKVV